jgi:hypothetical protein
MSCGNTVNVNKTKMLMMVGKCGAVVGKSRKTGGRMVGKCGAVVGKCFEGKSGAENWALGCSTVVV